MVTASQARFATVVVIHVANVAPEHLFHQRPEFTIIHSFLDPFELLTCDGSQQIGNPASLPFGDDADSEPNQRLATTCDLFWQSHLKHVSRTCFDQVKAGR
jgi:hypothetical protein